MKISIETFESKYIPVTESGCWLWTGGLKHGYGRAYYKGKVYRAHRLFYELFYGKFPKELFVCHKCDIPSCVNPEHLFLGTHKENMKDRNIKNRTAVGNRNGQSKLKESDVIDIFKSNKSQSALAKKYNVSQPTIGDIKSGKWWGWLTKRLKDD